MVRGFSRLTKVNLGWTVVIVTGLASFAIARKLIHNSRYEIMKSRQKVRDACKQDQLDEAEKY